MDKTRIIELFIDDDYEEAGIEAISLVSKPAHDEEWMAFNSETLVSAIQQTFGETPIRTYVTATEISNQQQFDRVIKSRSLI